MKDDKEEKMTQDFEEAKKAVLPIFLETVRERSPNIGADLQNSLASLGASMLAKSALEQQAKPPESPKQVVLESQAHQATSAAGSQTPSRKEMKC